MITVLVVFKWSPGGVLVVFWWFPGGVAVMSRWYPNGCALQVVLVVGRSVAFRCPSGAPAVSRWLLFVL